MEEGLPGMHERTQESKSTKGWNQALNGPGSTPCIINLQYAGTGQLAIALYACTVTIHRCAHTSVSLY